MNILWSIINRWQVIKRIWKCLCCTLEYRSHSVGVIGWHLLCYLGWISRWEMFTMVLGSASFTALPFTYHHMHSWHVGMPYFKRVGIRLRNGCWCAVWVCNPPNACASGLKHEIFVNSTKLSGSVHQWGRHQSSERQLLTLKLECLPPLLQLPVACSSWSWLLRMLKHLLVEASARIFMEFSVIRFDCVSVKFLLHF